VPKRVSSSAGIPIWQLFVFLLPCHDVNAKTGLDGGDGCERKITHTILRLFRLKDTTLSQRTARTIETLTEKSPV
jgi:hypothetical protein